METTKIIGTSKAWTTSKWSDIRHIVELVEDGKHDEAVGNMNYTNNDMKSCPDWNEVGIATITVELYPREQIVEKQVAGLNEQLRQHRIQAQEHENMLLDQISKLQALTFEAA